MSKDKQDLTRRLDRIEVQNEHMRLENDHMKKDVKEAGKENSQLQLQLSAARVQLKYNKETNNGRAQSVPSAPRPPPLSSREDEDFTDELIQKIERLTEEKAALAQVVEDGKLLQQQQKRQLDLAKQQNQMQQVTQQQGEKAAGKADAKLQEEMLKVRREKATIQATLDETRKKHDSDVKSLKEDKRSLMTELNHLKVMHEAEVKKMKAVCDRREEELRNLKSEVLKIKQDLKIESERHRTSIADLSSQIRKRDGDLERARSDLASVQQVSSARCQELTASQRERERLNKEVGEKREREKKLLLEMGTVSEARISAEEKCKVAEKERDESKKKCKELEVKMDILARSEKDRMSNTDDKVKNLEKALEEALIERHEILEAASKEIEHEKTIAIEREQAMMDDFEWKLREIECENRKKMKDMEKSVEGKIKSSQDEYMVRKDSEFTKMSINLRRETEEQMRRERVNLKQALDAQNSVDRDSAVTKFRLEKEREMRMAQKNFEEEKNKLEREKRSLQRKIDDIPNEVNRQCKEVRAECDRNLFEERRKAAKNQERNQEEFDSLRDDLNGQMTRLRAEYEEKIEELNEKVQNADTNRFSSMFQMKEEVETEFSERMEELRNMYKAEIDNMGERMEAEAAAAKVHEAALKQTIEQQRAEIDELNTYYLGREEEYEVKQDELLTRLSEQTSLAQKLQTEIDEYEWYSEGEEEAAAAAPNRPQSRGQHSRPSSTKPFEHEKLKVASAAASQSTLTVPESRYESASSVAAAGTATTVSSASSSASAAAAVPQILSEQGGYQHCQQQPNPPPRSSKTSEVGDPPSPGGGGNKNKMSSPDAAEESPITTYANPIRFFYL